MQYTDNDKFNVMTKYTKSKHKASAPLVPLQTRYMSVMILVFTISYMFVLKLVSP